jgi:hypothetical protein
LCTLLGAAAAGRGLAVGGGGGGQGRLPPEEKVIQYIVYMVRCSSRGTRAGSRWRGWGGQGRLPPEEGHLQFIVYLHCLIKNGTIPVNITLEYDSECKKSFVLNAI